MLLSRYLGKGDYGTYKQVIYIYSALLAVFTLGLPRAYSYFLPRIKNNYAKDVISKINSLFFVLGAIFSILLFISAPWLADALKNPDLESAVRLFSPVPFLMLPTMGLDGIMATYKKAKFLAFYNICTRMLMLLFITLPVVCFGGGYKEALAGFSIASLFSFIIAIYLKYLPIKYVQSEPGNITYKEILNFALPLLYASIWGMLISSADQFFISRYYGNEVFAEFSNGAIELPFIGMIIGACSTVLSPLFSKMHHELVDPQKEILPLWTSVFTKTAKLTYPLLIYCVFFSDILMTTLYGAEYIDSSKYFCIKSVHSFFSIIAVAPLIINIGKVKYYSSVHMYTALSIIGLEYLCVHICSSPYMIPVVSQVCQLGKLFAMLFIIAQFFKVGLRQLFPIKVILLILLPSIPILFILRVLLVDGVQIRGLPCLAVSFTAYMTIFFIWSIFAKLDYKSLIYPLISKKHYAQNKTIG